MGRFARRISVIVAIAALDERVGSGQPRIPGPHRPGRFDIYNLDRDRAIATYRQAVAADPDDAAAYRGLASALWLSITFRRGNMTVDDYMGKLSRPDLKLPPPPADVAAAFRDAVDQALALGRKHVAARPKDPEAHFQLGSAIGLRASYVVTVEGACSAAFGRRVARMTSTTKVLELDRNAPMPGWSWARIAMSCRRSMLPIDGSPTWRDLAAARKKGWS